MENKIKYVNGDATLPIGSGNKFIVHVCNDIGAWGKGFVLALSKRWKYPEQSYKNWAKLNKNKDFKLGKIQQVQVEKDISVINMIGQEGIYAKLVDGVKRQPIRYLAIQSCLRKVCELAKEQNASVHMPLIGAGLAGGDWNKIEEIVIEELVNQGIETVVYRFEPKK